LREEAQIFAFVERAGDASPSVRNRTRSSPRFCASAILRTGCRRRPRKPARFLFSLAAAGSRQSDSRKEEACEGRGADSQPGGLAKETCCVTVTRNRMPCMIAPESLFLGSSTDGCAHAVPAGAPLAWRRKGRAHNFNRPRSLRRRGQGEESPRRRNRLRRGERLVTAHPRAASRSGEETQTRNRVAVVPFQRFLAREGEPLLRALRAVSPGKIGCDQFARRPPAGSRSWSTQGIVSPLVRPSFALV
jgi:hypothetical protein